MSAAVSSVRRLIAELDSNECPCGGWKAKRRSFCGGCFRQLPGSLRLALYNRVGQGYEQAYAEAIEFLSSEAAR